MAEWLVEDGIGEERALLVEDGRAIAARLRWPGALEAGEIADAVLISRHTGSSRGRARFASGEEALVDRLPREAVEGAPLRLAVTRPRIGETGRMKLARARPVDTAPVRAPTLAQSVGARTLPSFPGDLWDDILDEARTGVVEFSGGSLQLSPTPAMTLVDVDGTLPPLGLALAAVPVLAATLARLDLAGSIGVDFPTLPAREDRKRLDAALAAALAGIDHERTAMNGFGFVQIVTRLERVSLLHRVEGDPAGAAARLLLRRAERLSGAGALLLTAHPRVIAGLRPAWQAELARRTGREIRLESDPALALEAPHAQLVTR